MKVKARIVEPKPSGGTMAVHEVWRRRRGVPFTATSAPLSRLVVEQVDRPVATSSEIEVGDLGTCAHGYHSCVKCLGRRLPNITVRLSLSADKLIGSFLKAVESIGNLGPKLSEADHAALTAESGRTLEWHEGGYRCSDCHWANGNTSTVGFSEHVCEEWPEGRVPQWCECEVHGRSPAFPFIRQAMAWRDQHADCKPASLTNAGLKALAPGREPKTPGVSVSVIGHQADGDLVLGSRPFEVGNRVRVIDPAPGFYSLRGYLGTLVTVAADSTHVAISGRGTIAMPLKWIEHA